MAELNAAYESVRTVDRRELHDKQQNLNKIAVPIVTPYAAPTTPSEEHEGSNVVDFGRYEGCTLEQLRRVDPEYLRWLSRHSSGIRYRRRIQELLDSVARAAASTAGRFGQ
jgi:broad specificity phosphatase PhoE